MIFLRANFLDTTTSLTTTNGTASLPNIFDRYASTQWISENAGTDATAATIRIVFPNTQTVSHILLRNHNLRGFSLHPGTTTSNFSPTAGVTANSATHHYFSVATTSLTEIVLSMSTTITANEEKTVGEFIVTNLLYDMATDRLPAAGEYKPLTFKKQIVSDMSDGGVSLLDIATKFRAKMDLNFVPTASVASLRAIYTLGAPFLFVPFETTTAWNGDAPECVWVGDFGFGEFSTNDPAQGFKGTIDLRQTPGGDF